MKKNPLSGKIKAWKIYLFWAGSENVETLPSKIPRCSRGSLSFHSSLFHTGEESSHEFIKTVWRRGKSPLLTDLISWLEVSKRNLWPPFSRGPFFGAGEMGICLTSGSSKWKKRWRNDKGRVRSRGEMARKVKFHGDHLRFWGWVSSNLAFCFSKVGTMPILPLVVWAVSNDENFWKLSVLHGIYRAFVLF